MPTSMRAKPLVLAAGLIFATTFMSSASDARAQSGRGGKSPIYAQAPGAATPFSGQRAYEHVKRLVEFGPRPSVSQELEAVINYILERSGGTLNGWVSDTPGGKKKMATIVVELKGQTDDTIIIPSHSS